MSAHYLRLGIHSPGMGTITRGSPLPRENNSFQGMKDNLHQRNSTIRECVVHASVVDPVISFQKVPDPGLFVLTVKLPNLYFCIYTGKMQGSIFWKIPAPPPGGGGNIGQSHLGEKIWKGKEKKGENVKEKGRKRKEKERTGKENEKRGSKRVK